MKKQTVYLFVFDTLSDWETGYAVAGLNSPAFTEDGGRYQVKTFATGAEPVVTAGGIRILPDLTLDQLTPEGCAMVILPGGGSWDAGGNLEILPTIKRFYEAGVPIAAICGATTGLARAGLLDQTKHTSNAAEYLAATGYTGAAHYQDELAISDNNVITAGATAPLEFAEKIFRKLNVYPDKVLNAWYDLFKTGNPAAFAQLAGG
jgi:putative intracellular protease/amidase